MIYSMSSCDWPKDIDSVMTGKVDERAGTGKVEVSEHHTKEEVT